METPGDGCQAIHFAISSTFLFVRKCSAINSLKLLQSIGKSRQVLGPGWHWQRWKTWAELKDTEKVNLPGFKYNLYTGNQEDSKDRSQVLNLCN